MRYSGNEVGPGFEIQSVRPVDELRGVPRTKNNNKQPNQPQRQPATGNNVPQKKVTNNSTLKAISTKATQVGQQVQQTGKQIGQQIGQRAQQGLDTVSDVGSTVMDSVVGFAVDHPQRGSDQHRAHCDGRQQLAGFFPAFLVLRVAYHR